jgi:hypothetical protein
LQGVVKLQEMISRGETHHQRMLAERRAGKAGSGG